MNYVGSNYYGRPVHSRNNDSKYFTVVVNNTRSGFMNVAILNDFSDFTYRRIITLSRTLPRVNCTVRNPLRSCTLTQQSAIFGDL
jgi:hypothetical protein